MLYNQSFLDDIWLVSPESSIQLSDWAYCIGIHATFTWTPGDEPLLIDWFISLTIWLYCSFVNTLLPWRMCMMNNLHYSIPKLSFVQRLYQNCWKHCMLDCCYCCSHFGQISFCFAALDARSNTNLCYVLSCANGSKSRTSEGLLHMYLAFFEIQTNMRQFHWKWSKYYLRMW